MWVISLSDTLHVIFFLLLFAWEFVWKIRFWRCNYGKKNVKWCKHITEKQFQRVCSKTKYISKYSSNFFSRHKMLILLCIWFKKDRKLLWWCVSIVGSDRIFAWKKLISNENECSEENDHTTAIQIAKAQRVVKTHFSKFDMREVTWKCNNVDVHMSCFRTDRIEDWKEVVSVEDSAE